MYAFSEHHYALLPPFAFHRQQEVERARSGTVKPEKGGPEGGRVGGTFSVLIQAYAGHISCSDSSYVGTS
jgi:hypothetical protein